MEFCKMNGIGNDFIIINNMELQIPRECYSEMARRLCERHLSLGADGFMVVEKADGEADYKMVFYNADGSLGEMCGNGARCICRYGYEFELADEEQRVETKAGLIIGKRIDKRNYRIRLNNPSIIRMNYQVEVDGKKYTCSYVELGDPGIPHVVIAMKNLKSYPSHELFNLGRKLRYHEAFSKGANVNFYEIEGEDHIYERTYERGVEDFTYACGTGTASVVAVLTLQGKVSGRGVCVNMAGGRLMIDVDVEEGQIKNIYKTGLTNVVARGVITDEELELEDDARAVSGGAVSA